VLPVLPRGFWRDDERYLEAYWRRFPGTWHHGDLAYVDADGFWYLLGRSDDTIKVAGKRLGPAEVESLLVADERVVEAAAVGVPDDVKGEALVCFVVLHAGVDPATAVPGCSRCSPRPWAGRWRRARSTSSRRCPRPATGRSCAGWPAPPTSVWRRVTSRPWRTPPSWRGGHAPIPPASGEPRPETGDRCLRVRTVA
jgi:hypothetical protein